MTTPPPAGAQQVADLANQIVADIFHAYRVRHESQNQIVCMVADTLRAYATQRAGEGQATGYAGAALLLDEHIRKLCACKDSEMCLRTIDRVCYQRSRAAALQEPS